MGQGRRSRRTNAREVKRIADDIRNYLKERKGGADTFEGVVGWWITRQRLIEAEDKVRDAVDYLCSQGVIQQRTLGDGTVLYSSAKEDGKDDDEKQPG
jgi:hypothetical protein